MRCILVVTASLLLTACGPLPHASTGAGLSGLRHGNLGHLYSDKDGVLVHVVVLKAPGATSPGSNGGGFRLGWGSTTVNTVWRESEGGDHRFEYSYRLFPTRFEVDGRRWSLDDGNVFVVKLDGNWRPAVDAVPIRLMTTNHAVVLAAIQKARSSDVELQSLRIVD